MWPDNLAVIVHREVKTKALIAKASNFTLQWSSSFDAQSKYQYHLSLVSVGERNGIYELGAWFGSGPSKTRLKATQSFVSIMEKKMQLLVKSAQEKE